jgi:transposase
MNHVAIDLGGRKSQICIRDKKGAILDERAELTAALEQFLRGQPPSIVVLETCSEAFHVADLARVAGHKPIVVPATLVRSLGVGARGIKNDRRDAQILSQVSCRVDLSSVHIPSLRSRHYKTLCSMREGLVHARTLLINTVRGWLRTRGLRIPTGRAETFAVRVYDTVTDVPRFLERQLRSLLALDEQLKDADQELAQLAKEDEICRRLMTVPGVGPVTSLRFVAALDEVGRFDTAHKVEAYLGLVPGENSSGDRQRRTSITKAGAPGLRHALVQAAWSAHRAVGRHPMVEWALEVERRRGKRIGVVALARKIAGILFAIWRDGSVYDARRAAKGKESSEANTPAVA